MTSRERIKCVLNHQESDRIPIDLGATACSGIHAVELIEVRKELGLKEIVPKVTDPMMFISEVDEDLRQKLEVDVVGIYTKGTLLGYRNENYKPWTLPNGTTVMMGEKFAYSEDEDGTIYAYPQGDTSVAPSARMRPSGLYFDNITRQEDLDKKEIWNGREDYKDQYTVFSEQDLTDIQQQVDHYYHNTDYALIGNYWNGGLGDNLHLPGAWLKDPKGVRDISEWMITMLIRPEYIKEFFQYQMELTLKNLALYYQVAGDKIEVMIHTGTDFGSQNSLLISQDLYRELFKPYHRQVNDWIHKNTKWKTFIHSCGAIFDLLPDIIDAGFDIVNPVQVSAAGMDAKSLKEKYGKQIVFWGGGCDPQNTLPNGTPEQVYAETKRNAEILSKDGGYVGGNVHNLQYGVPAKNFIAEMQAIKDARRN